MDTTTLDTTIDKIPSRVRINLWVSSDMHKALEDVSIQDNRSLSDLIREAIRDFISKDKRIKDGRNTD